ncbi:hypothetical protein ACFWM5_31920 [Streptomyces bobili]|uniref:hypothetical protein n=1 Tax=Streptomyces bobili TaxID=67280 RepID=UPI0036608808
MRGGRAELSLAVALPYPAPLAATVQDDQRHVTERTGQLTGLDVGSTRLTVASLTVPRTPVSPGPENNGGRTPPRWWSQRRVPVTLLTAAVAVSCGALAFDLVQVHTAHRTAAAWRMSALHWLSGHAPGDPAVVAVVAATALLGAWLVLLAVTAETERTTAPYATYTTYTTYTRIRLSTPSDRRPRVR